MLRRNHNITYSIFCLLGEFETMLDLLAKLVNLIIFPYISNITECKKNLYNVIYITYVKCI